MTTTMMTMMMIMARVQIFPETGYIVGFSSSMMPIEPTTSMKTLITLEIESNDGIVPGSGLCIKRISAYGTDNQPIESYSSPCYSCVPPSGALSSISEMDILEDDTNVCLPSLVPSTLPVRDEYAMGVVYTQVYILE